MASEEQPTAAAAETTETAEAVPVEETAPASADGWRVVTKTCFTCGQSVEGRAEMRVCSRCQLVAFCGKDCHRRGWRRHLKHCNPQSAAQIRRDAAREPELLAPPAQPALPVAPPAVAAEAPTAPAAPAEAVAAEAAPKPVPVATGTATVVGDGAALGAKERARMQAMAGTGRAQNMRTFVGCTDETKTLGKDDVDPLATVVFQNCTRCNYVLDTLCTKVFVNGCADCTIRVKGKVVSATMEVFQSRGLTVFCESAVHTVQADMNKDVVLNFADREHFKMVVWAGCESVSVEVAGAPLLKTGLPEMQRAFQNLRPEIDQFKIHFLGDKLVNERVVRLNNGFPTTQREADDFDRRQEANIQKLAQHMGITIKRKQREGPRVGRNDPCPCGSGKKYKACCGVGH